MSSLRVYVAATLAFFGALSAHFAHAQPLPPIGGTWQTGTGFVTATVTEWGEGCGPKPESVQLRAQGTVEVRVLGDDLEFRGSRVQRTDQCWSENRSVARVGGSVQDGAWRVICRTPPSEPRAETSTTTITRVGADRMEMRQDTLYDWNLGERRCRATLTTTRAYSRTSSAPTSVPPSQQPALEPQTPEDSAELARCATHGAAASLRLSPATTQVEPGARVCWNARLVDDRNCTVSTVDDLALTLDKPAGREGRVDGSCFFAGASAASAEGEFHVRATSGTFSARATVRVAATDFSDLRATRSTDGVHGNVNTQAEAGASAGMRATSVDASSSVGRTVAIVGIGLVGLALIAFAVWWARKQRKAVDTSEQDTEISPGVFVDESLSSAPRGSDRPRVDSGEAEARDAKICPKCRLGHANNAQFCARDGTALIPYSVYAADRRQDDAKPTAKRHQCPRCGASYPRDVIFCGKDGAKLGDD